jgi:hypothetical protein
MRPKSLWEAIGGGPANFPNYDARTGLGYGTQSGLHAHRQYQGTYPYREPLSPNEEEANAEEHDPELDSKVSKKLSAYVPSDPLATKKSDPFYYFGAATRLESLVRNPTRGSMVPMPGLYKGRDSGVAASNPWQVTKNVLNSKSTPHGTQFASILPEPSEDQEEAPEIFRLRSLIRAIFDENESKR